jgi:hypothetical protein
MSDLAGDRRFAQRELLVRALPVVGIGVAGGHTLKHLHGAVSTFWLLRTLMLRRPIEDRTPFAPVSGERGWG